MDAAAVYCAQTVHQFVILGARRSYFPLAETVITPAAAVPDCDSANLTNTADWQDKRTEIPLYDQLPLISDSNEQDNGISGRFSLNTGVFREISDSQATSLC